MEPVSSTGALVPPRRAIVGYALGSVGTGGFGTLPGLVLAYYLTDTLGVAAGLAGLAVTVPKIWDVVIDPVIGRASDASARRRGSRRAFLLTGALLLPVCFMVLFAVPEGLHGWAAAAWVVIAFLLATTAFSLFQVPYIALPAELAGSPGARTRLIAPRIAVLAVAILAFGAGGPALRDAAGGGRGGYLAMGVVTAILIGAGMAAAALLITRRREEALVVPAAAAPAEAGMGAAVRALRESRALRLLLCSFVLQALATGAMLAAAQYVATYTLHDESALTALFVALVAPALLVMPLARRVADRVGKRQALLGSTIAFCAATAVLSLARVAPGGWVLGCVALAGVAYAGMQLYPLALLPDVIAADAAAYGKDRAGVVAGVWTAGETAGLALGPAVVLGVLAATGFVSRTTPQIVSQPSSALWGVALTFSLVPAALAALSLVPLVRLREEEPTEPS